MTTVLPIPKVDWKKSFQQAAVFGKMCHGEFPHAQDFLEIHCLQRSTYRKRSKSAPDATLVEEVDHGGAKSGNLGSPTWGWVTGVKAMFIPLGGKRISVHKYIISTKDYVSSWVSVRCQINFGFNLYEPECFYG